MSSTIMFGLADRNFEYWVIEATSRALAPSLQAYFMSFGSRFAFFLWVKLKRLLTNV